MSHRQFGDFQTPLALTKRIVGILFSDNSNYIRVLEPTCGTGNFIRGIIESGERPAEIIGIDIQDNNLDQARMIAPPHSMKISFIKGDIFTISPSRDLSWETQGPLLIVGNPPWVTNSEIGSINGVNLPPKSNFKNLRGIDALTGRSNFDIAEFIWLKLINEFYKEQAGIALLCKTSVARNVLQYARNTGLPIAGAEIRMIDAKKWFGVSAEACLFKLIANDGSAPCYEAEIFGSLDAKNPERIRRHKKRCITYPKRYFS